MPEMPQSHTRALKGSDTQHLIHEVVRGRHVTASFQGACLAKLFYLYRACVYRMMQFSVHKRISRGERFQFLKVQGQTTPGSPGFKVLPGLGLADCLGKTELLQS